MIDINQSKKNVLNLEDDGWESEQKAVYLTRFNTHQTTSSDERLESSSSSEVKKQKSVTESSTSSL